MPKRSTEPNDPHVVVRASADGKPFIRRGTPSAKYSYPVEIDKDVAARAYILDDRDPHATKQTFLDIGGRDGKLKYLLGITEGIYDRTSYSANRTRFNSLYEYYGLDLRPAGDRVLAGDICSEDFLDSHGMYRSFFDVVYSNNVFEHLHRPWIAVKHISAITKVGGIIVTAVPFAQRFHPSPSDFFRYTHLAIESLFRTETDGDYETLETGYDTINRRMDEYGKGKSAMVPDVLGGWRETWITFTVLKRVR